MCSWKYLLKIKYKMFVPLTMVRFVQPPRNEWACRIKISRDFKKIKSRKGGVHRPPRGSKKGTASTRTLNLCDSEKHVAPSPAGN